MITPNTIQIELVQGCNRSCSFCGLRGMERKTHFMSKETLQHLIQLIQKSEWSSKVILAMHGEPTLHPNFLACVKMLRKGLSKASIHLMTNGLLHNTYTPKMCLDAGITNYILDLYKDTTHLEDEIDLEGMKVESIDKGLYVGYKRVLINRPIQDDTKVNRRLTNHCGAGMPPLETSIDKRCALPFRELTVRYNGDVCLCCNDFRGEYLVGNIMDYTDILDLWMSDRFQAARKMLYHRSRNFSPCHKCNALSHRVGLLPDRMGKEEMPQPNGEDLEIVDRDIRTNTIIVKRKWEV